jgi:hypothetical protein
MSLRYYEKLYLRKYGALEKRPTLAIDLSVANYKKTAPCHAIPILHPVHPTAQASRKCRPRGSLYRP